MKIAVNTRFLIKDKLEGIGIYTQEIFRRVTALLPQHEFYFLFDRTPSREFIFSENIRPVVVSPQARHPFLWYCWFEHSIPKALKEIDADLFISTDGYASLSTKVAQIVTIHDLGFEHYPHHTPFLVRNYYRHYTPRFCRKAEKIVAVSAFTKNDIIRNYSIDNDKIEVVYNGVESFQASGSHQEMKSLMNQFNIKDTPYFIFIGAIHPRKNVLQLLKAFELFKSEFQSDHQLVIVGRNAWMNLEVENYFQQMESKQDVIRIESIERSQLMSLLGNAFALIYPSLFEGFGIPIAEAMAAGIPVITSTTSSMPEVAGDAAVLVNPNSTEEIAAAMQLLITDPARRNELIEKGKERAKTFNWDISAKKVVEIIQEVLKKK
ncbi:MAG: glycosyltransferase family 4 protein [Sphingobacteriales bacterium]|nr:glycosyltransferase family 4 protein [Sphingobacteriales bacterium]